MTTITLTEFNRNPSHAARTARFEDVTITDHGVATLELRRVGRPGSRLDQWRRTGALRPARDRTGSPFPDFALDPDQARHLYAAFEEERAGRDY